MAGIEYRIDDHGQLRTLSRALRGIDLSKDVRNELVTSTARTRSAIRSSARSNLPSRGGLAALVAGAAVTTKVKMSSTVRVSIETHLAGHALEPIDRGSVRHPVFGRRAWVSQRVAPGYFTNPIRRDMPRIERGVERTIARVVERKLAALKG